jgi:hypothetical protein
VFLLRKDFFVSKSFFDILIGFLKVFFSKKRFLVSKSFFNILIGFLKCFFSLKCFFRKSFFNIFYRILKMVGLRVVCIIVLCSEINLSLL